ncbi:MAG: nucleotidyltransferase domain-containing protein [Phycisphaerae bacterium]|nr:nucleotidyltransferase domain-containing protein [Phycisphaerae bacterium]
MLDSIRLHGATGRNAPSVDAIAKILRDALNPERIVLFGSWARGTARADSDVDLLIELETDLPQAERSRTVSRLFPDRRWSLDALVFTPKEMAAARRSPASVLAAIESDGKVLYARQ